MNPSEPVGGCSSPSQSASYVRDPSYNQVPRAIGAVLMFCAVAFAVLLFPVALVQDWWWAPLLWSTVAVPLCLGGVFLYRRSFSHEIAVAELPQRYRDHLVAASAKVALIHETVRRLSKSAVAERLAPQVSHLDLVLWNLAIAARSTEELVRAEAATAAGGAQSLQAALAHRLKGLDDKFCDQLSSLEDIYRATKWIEAIVVLWESRTLELLGDAEQPMADAQVVLWAVSSTVSSMRQAVEEIHLTLDVDGLVGAGAPRQFVVGHVGNHLQDSTSG